ncbi:hypothetical protein P3342_003383 [Pyrenophora teres f. teres]|nr:hypothetical protein P3342_003383 [Pyrenophora teres f. teres]
MFFGKSRTAQVQVAAEQDAGFLPTSSITPSDHNLQHHHGVRYVTIMGTYTSVLPVAGLVTSHQISIRSNPSNRFHRSSTCLSAGLVLSALSLCISACNTITPPSTIFAPHHLALPPRALPDSTNGSAIDIDIGRVEIDPLVSAYLSLIHLFLGHELHALRMRTPF